MKRVGVLTLFLVVVGGPIYGSPVVAYEFAAQAGPKLIGSPVGIRLVNDGTMPITTGKTWDLTHLEAAIGWASDGVRGAATSNELVSS